ncbi:MAG: hypothetical protein COX81_01430 [Candidatus Magasanikbacteria bacterium CG_4_10_14_0_2_um_filter_37_12]|uniref:PEGA domain-containing protein n=1 Tax=Candidatus Magasanikbacteria bacterium CG_4_10_14_0_2_um_filter_37_12 TaxID=1974637 RepID=A0A2M7V8Q8_9BACT|nr:MAG: hypothetical protein COX81_01430 [Candidatus Magasanikbacteria bacterium CG_4_10_14_0_2_um_filter_37_12]
MSYPAIKLTRKIRIAIMIFLIIAFFVISPIIILYTAGYRYDFKAKKIQETGVISIDVKPKDSRVYLNGIELKNSIPVRLTNRLPGDYNIKIKKEGYHEWKKNITVESKKTYYIKDIILFKKYFPIKISDFENNFVFIYPSTNNGYALSIYKIENIFEVRLLDPKNNQETLVLRENMDEPPEIEWSPLGKRAIIKFVKNGVKNISLFSTGKTNVTNTYTFTDIKKNFVTQWSQENILTQDDTKILSLTDDDTSEVMKIPSSVWFIDDNDNLWQIDQETNNLLIKKDDITSSIHLPTENIAKIIDATETYIIVQNQSQEISVIMYEQNRTTSTKTLPSNFLLYNNSQEEWTTWSEWEIWNIYKDGTQSLVNRLEYPIDNIILLDDFGNIGLISGQSVLAFNQTYHLTYVLLDNTELENVWSDKQNKKIYFTSLDNNKTSLYKLEY